MFKPIFQLYLMTHNISLLQNQHNLYSKLSYNETATHFTCILQYGTAQENVQRNDIIISESRISQINEVFDLQHLHAFPFATECKKKSKLVGSWRKWKIRHTCFRSLLIGLLRNAHLENAIQSLVHTCVSIFIYMCMCSTATKQIRQALHFCATLAAAGDDGKLVSSGFRAISHFSFPFLCSFLQACRKCALFPWCTSFIYVSIYNIVCIEMRVANVALSWY